MVSRLKYRSPFIAFLHDLATIPIAWYGAYWLYFNLGAIPADFMLSATISLGIIMVIQSVAFYYFGLYRGIWRFASLPDHIRIIKAVVVGISISALILFLATRMESIPRSVFPIYAALLLLLLSSPRVIYRWYKDRVLYMPEGKRVLVVGAGRAGELLARDLSSDPTHNYHPIGFVDDDVSKLGREVRGIRVIGTISQIPDIARDYAIDIIIIAIPAATSKQMRRIIDYAEKSGSEMRILPRMQDVVSGNVTISNLREVSIEDLLGRESINLDVDSIRHQFENQVVMISGAGGSIGSELARQLLRLDVKKIILVDNSEYNLFTLSNELADDQTVVREFLLADVTDLNAINHVIRVNKPDIVFHAAAYKHVPLLEPQVREAMKNNVLGTYNVARAAIEHGVEKFVLISTDKAVNPSNTMGATKRIAEILCHELDEKSDTQFITVRFGNVLGSNGSVIPTFREQIKNGGPVTVTDPAIKRFFMTIPEACQLIMQAASMGQGGEIFVLDMGDAVNIAYLAEQMIRLSGYEPGVDIEIKYIGLRPGEKMHEELFHEHEKQRSTKHEKILLAQQRDNHHARLEMLIEQIHIAIEQYDEQELKRILATLVPEMASQQLPESSNILELPTMKAH